MPVEVQQYVNLDSALDYQTPGVVASALAAAVRKKDSLSVAQLVLRGFFSGMLLALATATSMTVAGVTNKATGAILFPWGFCLIMLWRMELVTGNFAAFAAGLMHGETTFLNALRNWSIVYLSNFAGGALTGVLIAVHLNGDPTTGAVLLSVAHGKVDAYADDGVDGWFRCFVRGIICNTLVCSGVLMALCSRTVVGRIVGCWFPVFAFFALGTEHIVVNFFVLVAAPVYRGEFSTSDIFAYNIVPTTLGNILGGCVVIGLLFPLAVTNVLGNKDDATAKPAASARGSTAPPAAMDNGKSTELTAADSTGPVGEGRV